MVLDPEKELFKKVVKVERAQLRSNRVLVGSSSKHSAGKPAKALKNDLHTAHTSLTGGNAKNA